MTSPRAVASTPETRVDRLLEAVLSIAGDLDIDAVLGRVVRAACDLVGARYAALGVIDEDGEGLAAFVHHGMDEVTVRDIGDLPTGRGLLGQLITDPRPLRLTELSEHPSSVGFPPGHPPMRRFLGVPIEARDQAFGNLYLTEKQDGTPFDEEDEKLLVGLAAAAGAAIANARLYDAARRREAWRSAVLEVSEAVLAGTPRGALTRVAELGSTLVDADAACLVEQQDHGLWVVSSVGDAPSPGSLTDLEGPVWAALTHGQAVRVEHGPMLGRASMWVPVRAGKTIVAALGVGREVAFTARDEQLLTEFGAQVSFACSFEHAQDNLRRLSLIEDRERIGRDLHDTVIQRLFATGLALQATSRRCQELPDVAARIERAVDDIDETVREIRTTIFALQSPASVARGIRHRILAVLEELEDALPPHPRVRFDGPVDTVVNESISGQLMPVVREALTNVAKHARATQVSLLLGADRRGLRLLVADDGVGLPPDPNGGLGLRNLRERAENLGGRLEVRPSPMGRGTELEWRLPAGGAGPQIVGAQ